MYYLTSLTLVGQTPTLQVELRGEGLNFFFCLEEQAFSGLHLVEKTGYLYTFSKTTEEPFASGARVTIFGLPLNLEPPVEVEPYVEFIQAYTIYTHHVLKFRELSYLSTLIRANGRHRVVDNAEAGVNEKLYIGELAAKFSNGSDFGSGAISNKTLLVLGNYKPSDRILIAKTTEQSSNIKVTNSKIITHFLVYDDVIIIPNLTIGFTPNFIARSAPRFATIGTDLEIPIDADTRKPLVYEGVWPKAVTSIVDQGNIFENYILNNGGTTLEVNDNITTGLINVTKAEKTDRTVTISYGFYSRSGNLTTLRRQGLMVLKPENVSLSKITFALDPITNYKIYIRVQTSNSFSLVPQQLATAGIESSNTSWTKETKNNITTFISDKVLTSEDGADVTIGWKHE